MGPKRRKGSGFRCPDCGIIFDRVRAFERHYRLRGKLKQRASKLLHICRANMNTTGIITDESFEAYQLRAQSTRRSQLFSAAAPRKASPSRSISSSRSKAGCDFSVEDSHSRLHQRIFNDEQHATEANAAKQDSSTLSESDKRFTAGYTFETERPSYDVASSYPAERELQCPPLDGYESYESWASGAGELRTSHESSTFHAEAGGEDVRSRDNSISQLPTSDSGVEERNSFGRDDATEGGGSHRSADVDGGNKPQVDDGMMEDNPRYGHPPSLGDIHRMVGARLGGECMEGLGIKERFFGRAKSKEYTPFKALTEMLLFVFAVKHQISRVGISDLFSIFRYVDEVPGDTEGEGATFDVADVPQDGEHFVSRLREYLPLFEVWTRNVVAKQSAGVGASAKVYDIPITHILESLLKSPSAMDEMRKNPGGAVLSKDEGEGVGLGSEHLFSMATRPVDNARRNYMHGRLASSMPQYNTDGFISLSGRKVYISDTVMCDLRDADATETRQVPCRVVKSYFDEETLRLVVVVRCFRNANEVLHIGYSHKLFRRNGLVRLWEENGMGSEINLRGVKQVLDLVEILTADEVSNDIHKRPWRQGERRSGWSFVAEGFTERKAGGRFARVGRIRDGWRRHGATDENFPDMRAAGVYHNQDNRPFLNLTTCIYVDDFNVWGMTNPHSEGASYFALPTLDRRLLRLSRHLYPTTMAAPGASYDAAMAFSCGVVGELEKGCFADVVLPGCNETRQAFARGGLLSVIGDAPQRAGLLYTKNANNRTLHPCTMRNVTQSQEDDDRGGDLGDRNYDVVRNKRTRGEVLASRDRLREAGIGSSAAVELSRKLGVAQPAATDGPSALYDLVSLHQPMESCCPELLHQNHLGLLSPQGRAHVSGVLRQGNSLYGPGVAPLKDIVKNYAALTGSHKAFLASIQLVVFRGILSSVGAMLHFMKPVALNQMRRDVWGGWNDEDVLGRLKGYLQASSALSFAARGQQFTDEELRQLRIRAEDYVENARLTLGRSGVRTSTHNWIHWTDTILNHGAPLDASIGEQGHQRHKRSNKSGSGRDPAAHHARRVNTLLALRRLTNADESWKATHHDYSAKKTVTRDVHAGAGCTRVLKSLDGALRGGLDSPRDPDEGARPTTAMARGTFHGSAQWNARMLDVSVEGQRGITTTDGELEWEACLAESGIVPHVETVLESATWWYGCDRTPNNRTTCEDPRYPICWEGSGLNNDGIRCSRFKHGVPPRASSGLGRFKGGDVRSATCTGTTPRDWAVGDGSGEDVEIFTSRRAHAAGLSVDGGVTLAKILYFFDHEGNKRAGNSHGQGPMMEYVLVYEYVTRGKGRSKLGDHVTDHPTYFLQGRPRTKPSVFPVGAIRRHVHMFHMCPLGSFAAASATSSVPQEMDAPLTCGLHSAANTKGGGKVWKHHYHLASAAQRKIQRDSYLLNEHWHSAFQDGVV